MADNAAQERDNGYSNGRGASRSDLDLAVLRLERQIDALTFQATQAKEQRTDIRAALDKVAADVDKHRDALHAMSNAAQKLEATAFLVDARIAKLEEQGERVKRMMAATEDEQADRHEFSQNWRSFVVLCGAGVISPVVILIVQRFFH